MRVYIIYYLLACGVKSRRWHPRSETMANWEKDLPPIARERLMRIGQLTSQEKENLLDSEKVDSLLSEFYRGDIGPEGVWSRLRAEGNLSLFREAQMKLVSSLSLAGRPADLQRNSDGIIAIETLKDEQNTPAVERSLKLMQELQIGYRAEIDHVYKGLRGEVERDPKLRIRQVRQGKGTAMVQLTVDEATQQLPQWSEFLSQHEQRYAREFAALLDTLRGELG
jgi:hypothetical protein